MKITQRRARFWITGPALAATRLAIAGALAISAGCSGGASHPCLSDSPPYVDGSSPCAADKSCVEGCSCIVNKCVPDNTLGESDTCTKDQQCAEGLVCAPSLFQCLKPCSTYYASPAACNAGQYCKPVIYVDGPACGSGAPCAEGFCAQRPNGESYCRFFGGVCVQSSDCIVDPAGGAGSDCNAGEVCTQLSSTARVCLTGCQVTWPSGYYDNCASGPAYYIRYCTPVGAAGSQRLVCIDTLPPPNAGQAGDLCDTVATPCAEGAACVRRTPSDDPRCYDHCDHNNAIAGAAYCATIDASKSLCCTVANQGVASGDPIGDDFGICAASCP